MAVPLGGKEIRVTKVKQLPLSLRYLSCFKIYQFQCASNQMGLLSNIRLRLAYDKLAMIVRCHCLHFRAISTGRP